MIGDDWVLAGENSKYLAAEADSLVARAVVDAASAGGREATSTVACKWEWPAAGFPKLDWPG